MTGFPDDRLGGPPEVPGDGPGSVTGGGPGGEGGADRLEQLLRPPTPFLHAPPGAFERIRRKAVRRRRTRAAVGSLTTVAAIAGTFYLVGSLGTGNDEVVGPPASSPRTTTAPTTPTTQGATATPSPPPAATATGSPEGHQTPTSATPTATADPSAGGASTPTASPTTPVSTPMCTAAQLTTGLDGGDAGAGNSYRYLVFTNKSTTTCHLTGFPGVSMLDADGKQIGQPATRTQTSYTQVVLAPGGSASDTIHTVNQQGPCLATSTQLRIYPPGSKASQLIAGQITECYNTFEITPLSAGKGGTPAGP
jgi:hypothetical protein